MQRARLEAAGLFKLYLYGIEITSEQHVEMND